MREVLMLLYQYIYHTLPNGNKLINYNNNLYYNNPILRILTQTDYNTLNTTIQNNYNKLNTNISSKCKIAYGSYTGNAISRQINVGFYPTLCIIMEKQDTNYPEGYNSNIYDSTLACIIRGNVFISGKGTTNQRDYRGIISLSSNGVNITIPTDGTSTKMFYYNMKGTVYYYSVIG